MSEGEMKRVILNWTFEGTSELDNNLKEAQRVLEEVKKKREQFKYQLVKICDRPLTYKEIRVYEDTGDIEEIL